MNIQNLIRWAGIPAMAAGVIFAVIQPIHEERMADMNSPQWYRSGIN